MTEIFGYIFVH